MNINPTADACSRRLIPAIVAISIACATGCQSPPSVAPLIAAADGVIADERRLLSDDAMRAQAWVQQQRETLHRGFVADLSGKDEVDSGWVLDGVTAYVAAREALLRHELKLRDQSETRRENLRLAGLSIRRALGLLQRQDALFADTPDLRRWIERRMQKSTHTFPEASP